jgi:hypothetical protein
MEGVPQMSKEVSKVENVEQLSDWRKLRDEGPQHGAEFISRIPGFDTMTSPQKVTALLALMHDLEEENKNRFAAKHVADQIDIYQKKSPYEEAKERLAA